MNFIFIDTVSFIHDMHGLISGLHAIVSYLYSFGDTLMIWKTGACVFCGLDSYFSSLYRVRQVFEFEIRVSQLAFSSCSFPSRSSRQSNLQLNHNWNYIRILQAVSNFMLRKYTMSSIILVCHCTRRNFRTAFILICALVSIYVIYIHLNSTESPSFVHTHSVLNAFWGDRERGRENDEKNPKHIHIWPPQ